MGSGDSALQNDKFLHFFLFLWVIFAHLDPDPQHTQKPRRLFIITVQIRTVYGTRGTGIRKIGNSYNLPSLEKILITFRPYKKN